VKIEYGVDVNIKSRDAKEDGNSTPLLFAARFITVCYLIIFRLSLTRNRDTWDEML